MKIVTYFIVVLIVLVPLLFGGELQRSFPTSAAVMTVISFTAICFAIIKTASEILERSTRYKEELPISLPILLLLGVVAGVISSLIGGILYMFPDTPIILPTGIQLQPQSWYDARDPIWSVKMVRLICFGGIIGIVLALLLTEAAYCASLISLTDVTFSQKAARLMAIPAVIVVLVTVFVYLGGHMSEVGKQIAAIVPNLLKPIAFLPWASAIIDQPLQAINFGSGICENLKEYWSLEKDIGGSNNNYCDVGAIPGSVIMLITGIFLMMWMCLFYYDSLGRVDRNGKSRKQIVLRVWTFLILTISSVTALIWTMEPLDPIVFNAFRQIIIDSVTGLIVFGVIALVVLISSIVLVTWDVRTGRFASNS